MNEPILIDAIYKREPWDDKFSELLKVHRFTDVKKVWELLIHLSSHSNFYILLFDS